MSRHLPHNKPTRQRRPSLREAAVSVVSRLQQAGHVALFAGGCVRDRLMGKRPHDYDVATSATPDEVTTLFRRTQQVGAKFGVILVRTGPFAIEVATFRTDAEYEDGRHPTRVHFTDARRDAQRRDFTINGMFYDPIKREVIDHVGGQADLEAARIRAIGDPLRRFAEDHLRILRAVRFAARFGFKIDAVTGSAMRKTAASISRISLERIRDELDAILSHPSRARGFDDLHTYGVLQHLWPGAPQILPHRQDIRAILSALPAKARFELCLGVLLHALSAAQVAAACDALRCSNHCKRTVTWLCQKHEVLLEPSEVNLADLKLLMANEAFQDLLALLAALLRSRSHPPTACNRIRARARAIPPKDVAPPPFVDGVYLEQLGVPKGPIYKRVLSKVYYAQLNEELETKAAARAQARRMLDGDPSDGSD